MPASFPRLKTGAIAQYPTVQELTRPVETVRFLDMGRQSYADGRAFQRRWRLRLNLLDDAELAQLIEFFVAMRGSLGRFDFEDPATGDLVTNCRFENDELALSSLGEFDAQAFLTVRESR